MTTQKLWNSSSALSPLPHYSHLYLEKELRTSAWAEKANRLIAKFPKATVVEIDHFSQITQRRSASWNDQKRSPKLVVAKKQSDLLYPCSDVAPSFGHKNFYYAVPMQNCLYDCEYCYLQGMYTSAHLVYFINQQDMIEAAVKLQQKIGPLYICIAYDNDILAVENLFGVAREWIDGVREHPDITVEIRTKSANFRSLEDVVPCSNIILAWTLSPATVIERFEAKTPGLSSRIQSLEKAVSRGWRVRLCFDPLLPIKEWRSAYQDMLDELDDKDLWSKLEDVSYGLFRMPKQFLRQAKKARPDSALLHNAQSREERGYFTLSGTDQEELLKFMGSSLQNRLAKEKVWQT